MLQGASQGVGGQPRRALADLTYTDLAANISVNASAVERTAVAVSDIVSQGRLLVRIAGPPHCLHKP